MANPVISELNVKLAYLLGDPFTPLGGKVTATDDGIAYAAILRDYFLTKGLRQFVKLRSAASLAASGIIDSYTRSMPIDANPFPIPGDLARLIDVQWYGKRVNNVPFADGRRNSVYWQNTPMYRIIITLASAELIISNVSDPDKNYCYINYIRRIPILSSNPATPTEDILINENYHDDILAFAEITGRRFHQEMHQQLKQDVIQDMAIEKQNEG
jgi:hypothetical protein